MVAIAVQLICFLFRLSKTNEKIENRNKKGKSSQTLGKVVGEVISSDILTLNSPR